MALRRISSELQNFRLFFLEAQIHLLLIIIICLNLVPSLCITGYLWAFCKNSDVHGAQVALTLLVIWLHMHLNCCLVVTAGLVFPMKFMPFAILAWSSVSLPRSLRLLESIAGLDGVVHMLPSYQHRRILDVIWTEGRNEPLDRSLSILFVWWLFVFIALNLGIYKRFNQLVKYYSENELEKMPL